MSFDNLQLSENILRGVKEAGFTVLKLGNSPEDWLPVFLKEVKKLNVQK